ncbi:MAG: hypothetical protein HFI67_04235 [Lachnospiraceae bacterium]|nr:hypothetical protein [Lachnospiraceae bacterium]
MTGKKQKQKINYLLAGFGLLLALLLISSLGMWLVQEFLEHFDGKKYGEAVALADDTWQQSTESVKSESASLEQEDFGEEGINAILLDGNRLNDIERLQVLSGLSMKLYGSAYNQYLEREPIEEIELSEMAAREQAVQFLELLNSAASGYTPYVPEEIKMSFRADKVHPSASLWVADLTSYGCIVFLYMDAKTGLPVRFYAGYNLQAAGYGKGAEPENIMTLDAIAGSRDWQTGNPEVVNIIFSYLTGYLGTNFYTNPVTSRNYQEGDESGYWYISPIEQWMSDDYRYVLTCAFREGELSMGHFSELDLVLSPLEGQEEVRMEFTERYHYWGGAGTDR